MQLRSWNRFKTTALAVVPELMGESTSFVHEGSIVTIKIPPLERVSDRHDDLALATCNSWHGEAREPIQFNVHAVDVSVACRTEIDLPDAVLTMNPNAYKLIAEDMQAALNSIAGASSNTALRTFEYWISLLRWVTGSHRIAREVRLGSESGWPTYLHEQDTGKTVWIESQRIVVQRVHAVSVNEWRRVNAHALAGEEPPIHSVLLDDAKHCIDVGDYRRALVDLSVACEVYLRRAVLESLPPGVLEDVIRLIEEANINQFIAHLFPALLDDAAHDRYKSTVKKGLNSLFSRRNKLMHVAELEQANRETCERFLRAVETLFRLELRSKAEPTAPVDA